MNTSKTTTNSGKLAADPAIITRLEEIPNVGKAIAADLRGIGIATPGALRGREPLALYREMERVAGKSIDPCMLDVMIAAVRFMERGEAHPWWQYTAERKAMMAKR